MSNDNAVDQQRFDEWVAKVRDVRTEVAQMIVGQETVVESLLMSIFAGGHCLMMGVPGLAKTLIVSTLSRVLDLGFKRIQFTPDLMPGDITGSEVIEELPDGGRKFVFARGPLFTNMILADEINRTPPKTQAALLEAMQERHVTVGNATYALPEPFFVLATQNPIEQEGTYPLPEAQQDRFMFFLWVDYPELDEERAIIARTTGNRAVTLRHVLDGAEIQEIQKMVREIPVSDEIIDYAARLVRATRLSRGGEGDASVLPFVRQYLQWGAGPRAGQYLVLGAKARAFINGHTHVATEDIRAVAHAVLRHRIIVNFAAAADHITSGDVVDRILKEIPR